MTLKNVEKIEAQEQHQKSWYQKFRTKLVPAVVTTGVLIASSAHAEDTPDFIGTAKTAMTGLVTNLGGLFVVAIGITLLIMAFTLSKGGIKKAG
ncbi:hypothetical protein [Acinetobacter seifertii]|uniref:hypothetical protein n=1 Tax=Acinetobacter seifertii TaxID=1530123 RepID=UPI0012507601|nr:hypothetical protein [Acinetobacter seifertii]